MQRPRATTMFTTVCFLVGVLVVLQLWLLSSSVESALGGDVAPARFAVLAQLALFATSAGLLRYALVVDRRARG